MATKKNENKKSLKFIDILNDFREGKEIDVLSFIEDRDIQELMVILDKVFLQLNLAEIQINDNVRFEIEKQGIVFFYGLLQCTSLIVEKDDIDLNNYDMKLEDLIYQNSLSVRKLYKMIDNLVLKNELSVVSDLTKELQKAPSIEDLQNLEQGLDNIFSKRSTEDLKKIESILEFNDPNMKMIKDIIMQPEPSKGGVISSGNKVT